MKKEDIKWGDIISFSINNEVFVALLEEGGRFSGIQPKDKLPEDIEFSYATPEQVRGFMRWMIESGRLLHAGYDTVNKPEHYASSKIECIDAMIAAKGIEKVKIFCECNAFKYIWRSDKKNGSEDIKKSMWYLNKYIELSKIENTQSE